MTRARILLLNQCFTVALATVVLAGCAVLKGSNESIIRIQAAQNPAEAARLTLVGVKALHHGEVERAADKFTAAIDADKTYGPAHNNLGLLHYEQGNLYQAALAFEQAMDLMPQDPAVYYNMALTLETAGRVFEAMDLYSQAVEMDPANPNFLGNLVRLRLRLGEDDPTVVTQLQDLILIETRPDWRRWADRQLSLTFNPTLDRGPETPEFDTQSDEDRSDEEERLRNNIIELTPIDDPDSIRWQRNEIPAPPPDLSAPQTEELPTPPSAPISDGGSLNDLPPSIDVPEE